MQRALSHLHLREKHISVNSTIFCKTSPFDMMHRSYQETVMPGQFKFIWNPSTSHSILDAYS